MKIFIFRSEYERVKNTIEEAYFEQCRSFISNYSSLKRAEKNLEELKEEKKKLESRLKEVEERLVELKDSVHLKRYFLAADEKALELIADARKEIRLQREE